MSLSSLEIFTTTLPQTVHIGPSWSSCSRVGILDVNVCAFANSDSVYLIKLPYSNVEPNQNKTKNEKIPFPTFVRDYDLFEFKRPTHQNLSYSEVCVRENTIGCIDEKGHVDILTYTKGVEETLTKPDDRIVEEKPRPLKKRKISSQPLQLVCSINNDSPPFEKGGGHISFHPESSSTFATSVYFSREVKIYREGNVSNRVYLSHYPGPIQFFERSSANVLGVIEETEVLVYDDRLKSNVGRIQPRSERLLSLEIKDNIIAVGDNNRGVMLYDVRKWSVFWKIKKSLKTGISYTKFSTNNDVMYVSGSNEMSTNTTKKKGPKGKDTSVHFRGNIVGMDIVKGCALDTIVTVTQRGSLYFLRNSFSLLL